VKNPLHHATCIVYAYNRAPIETIEAWSASQPYYNTIGTVSCRGILQPIYYLKHAKKIQRLFYDTL